MRVPQPRSISRDPEPDRDGLFAGRRGREVLFPDFAHRRAFSSKACFCAAPGLAGSNAVFPKVSLQKLHILWNFGFVKQFQTTESPILWEAISHAEKEILMVAIGKNEQGDALVGSVAEELLLGSNIQNAASFGFDKNLRAAVTQQRVIHAPPIRSMLGLNRPKFQPNARRIGRMTPCLTPPRFPVRWSGGDRLQPSIPSRDSCVGCLGSKERSISSGGSGPRLSCSHPITKPSPRPPLSQPPGTGHPLHYRTP